MKYGLIGEKLGHSFSKEIHESINDYNYDLIEVSKDDFEKMRQVEDEIIEHRERYFENKSRSIKWIFSIWCLYNFNSTRFVNSFLIWYNLLKEKNLWTKLSWWGI